MKGLYMPRDTESVDMTSRSCGSDHNMCVHQLVPSPARLSRRWKAGDDVQQPQSCVHSVDGCRSQLESLLAEGQSSKAKEGANSETEDAFGLTSPAVAGK